jgi:hypothetical protein
LDWSGTSDVANRLRKSLVVLNRWRKGGLAYDRFPPFNLVVVSIAALIVADALTIFLHIAGVISAICIYMSALVLMVELLSDAGIKILVALMVKDNLAQRRKEIRQRWEEKKPLSAEEKAELQYELRITLASNLHYWFAIHLIAFVRKVLFLLPTTAWIDDQDVATDRYLLRFSALFLLVLAINFDICSRVFG